MFLARLKIYRLSYPDLFSAARSPTPSHDSWNRRFCSILQLPYLGGESSLGYLKTSGIRDVRRQPSRRVARGSGCARISQTICKAGSQFPEQGSTMLRHRD